MKNHKICEICANQQCFLFKHCAPEWHHQLTAKKTCVRYKKNQQIIREGEYVDGIYFIQSGKVKVYKETHYRGQIIRLATGGDILGHRVLGENKRYPISASTIEDSLICFIEQDTLFRLMKDNAMLSIRMMMYYADELKKTETRLRNMAIMTVRERVADALLMVQKTFGSDNGSILDVDFSRKDIAEIAGTYAEQVSRYITEFKNEKILDLDGKKIILLQPDKLREIIEQYGEDA